MNHPLHHNHLHQALTLAHLRRGFCSPNPSVGAVIVQHQQTIATGYHVAAGHPHAEINALQKIQQHNLSDATLYVTLEPCCHHGKTPPCTDAIIQSGIKQVVYAYRDPNPLVAGKGEKKLLEAGIACEHVPLPEIDSFYKSYSHWQQTKKPFVTAKMAFSLDGKIAGKNGQPVSITGRELNAFTHSCRKAADAILTTAKTIRCDDPQLNVRLDENEIAKPLYILDTHLTLPVDARIFKTAQSITIFHASHASIKQQHVLNSLGARCIPVESSAHGLNLSQVLEWIGQDGIHDLWIEAGATSFSAFLKENLLQRIFFYMAPWAMGEGISGLPAAIDFRQHKINCRQFGQDILCEIDL